MYKPVLAEGTDVSDRGSVVHKLVLTGSTDEGFEVQVGADEKTMSFAVSSFSARPGEYTKRTEMTVKRRVARDV